MVETVADTIHADALKHYQSGDVAGAKALCHKALAGAPDDAFSRVLLGAIAYQERDLGEAEVQFRTVLVRHPRHADARANLASVLQALGRYKEAETEFLALIAAHPKVADLHYNLGNLMRETGRLGEAVTSYRQAVTLQPNFVSGWLNMGIAQKDAGNYPDAQKCFQEAKKLAPQNADVCNNLGALHSDLGLDVEAMAFYLEACKLNPGFEPAWVNLGELLYKHGKIAEAQACFAKAPRRAPQIAMLESQALAELHFKPDVDRDILAEKTRAWGEQFAPASLRLPPVAHDRQADRVIRLGYVSADLRAHPVGHFLEGVLLRHDRTRFHLTCYYNNGLEDDVSQRIKRGFDAWHPVFQLNDDALAQQIRADQIDILIDLSGHTASHRLLALARKPAPVQASWIYFNSTGMSAMDYLIADGVVIPPDDDHMYVEKVMRLPRVYTPFTLPEPLPAVSESPAVANGYVTFGSFNRWTKLNTNVLACWAKVIQQVPDSRLYLKSRELGNDTMRQKVVKQFAELGIGADRLLLEAPSPRADMLACYSKMDIALDPFPHTGGATTVEALMMGVPVVSMAGDHFVSRMGMTYLMAVGKEGWIGADEHDYVYKALALASDPKALNSERQLLRERFLASAMCDTEGFARELEQIYAHMWRSWCGDECL